MNRAAFSVVGIALVTATICAQPAKREKLTLAGHKTTVRVVFGPGGQLATFSDADSIRLYDANRGLLTIQLTGRVGPAFAAAFTPNGRTLAISDGQAIHFLETSTGKVVAAGGGPLGGVERMAYSPDGKTLACGAGSGEIRLWDVESQKVIRTFNADHPPNTPVVVSSVAWSADGKHLAQTYTDGHPGPSYLRLWDAATGKLARTLIDGQKSDLWSAVFSADGKLLAAGDMTGAIRVFETKGWTPVREFKVEDQLRSLAFAADSKTLAVGGRRDIHLCDATTGKELKKLTGHENWVLSLSFAPDSATLASGSSDKTARVWPIH